MSAGLADGTARRRRVLAACCGAHVVQDGLTSTIYLLLPVLAQTFSLGYGQTGLIRAAHGAAMWLLELPAGVAAERIGERRLLVFGLLMGGSGYVTLSQAGGYHGVLLALGLAGLGAAFQHSLCSALVARTFDGAARRTALGTYNASGDVGKLAFTGVASLLLGMGVAWQGVAALYGAAAVGAALLLGAVLRRTRAGDPVLSAPGEAPAGWGVRDRTGFATLATIVFLDIAVQDAFFVFVAFVMIANGVSATAATAAVVLTLAGGFAGKFGCGYLTARMGTVRALVLTETATAAGIVALILTPAPAAFALLPFIGVVLQGSSTVTYGAVSDLVRPERQSRGFAAIYTTTAAASVLSPIGFGLVGDGLGLDVVLWSMAVMVLVPLPLCVPLSRGLRSAASADRQ